MRTRSFHTFVALRYLMARPRRVSGAIVWFAAIALAVALAMTVAALIAPLGDERLAFAMPLPSWLAFALGGGVVGAIFGLVRALLVGVLGSPGGLRPVELEGLAQEV